MKFPSPHSSPVMQRSASTASIPVEVDSPRKVHLSVPNIATIWVKMHRASHQAKPHHVESSSGEPQTHPDLAGEGATCEKKIPLVHMDSFLCLGGVNAKTLLRASRSSLMERAESIGANVLVNEQWKCTICPKHRASGTFRVNIRYSAFATRSDRPDPHKPIALDNAKGVPGLMTILKRNE